MGGNDGKSTLGDAWALDTSEKPYQWRKITDAGEMPSPRYCVYPLYCMLCLSLSRIPSYSLDALKLLQDVRNSSRTW